MSDPQAPLPPTPIVIAAPVPGPKPVEGINIFSDKYEYKTIESSPVEHLDIFVNRHIKEGWKLYGDMKPLYADYRHTTMFYQVMIRKLVAGGGKRASSVRTRKAKLKSHPPHKRQ